MTKINPTPDGANLNAFDPGEVQQTSRSERFSAALAQLERQVDAVQQTAGTPSASPTRMALTLIAKNVDLTNAAEASAAVRESARQMIRLRLNRRHRRSKQGERLAEELSDYVSADPVFKSKVLSVLGRLK